MGGGYTNYMVFSCCSVSVGGYNTCMENSSCSAIVGGSNNCINTSLNSFVGGGSNNKIFATLGSKTCNVIVGGQGNQINNSCMSFIGGGSNNCIDGRVGAFILGCSLTATANKTAFMNNTVIACSLTVGGTTQLSTTVGRIDATNDILSYSTSDERLKENIIPIGFALEKIERINGVTFDWKKLTEEEKTHIHGNKGHDIGVIAQEIEEILPEAVITRDSGYKAVNYEKIIPLLIEAVKDQQRQINELKRKI